MPRFPQPHTCLKAGRATFRFYLGDCLDVLDHLPSGSIDAIVTSPPYNLGIRYRSYDDTIPRGKYLERTGQWVRRASVALGQHGSLFLNVGAKPTDPWTALDVAQAVRPHLHLQNTIHWIKSIAIEKAVAGSRARLDEDLAVGHYKPINSQRFLHDCHEFVFHFTPGGGPRLDRQAIGVRYLDPSNVGRWRAAAAGVRCRGNTWFIPYETIQSREKDRPHPGHVPSAAARDVPPAARTRADPHGRRPVSGTGLYCGRLRTAWDQLRRHRDGRGLSGRSGRADSRRPSYLLM